MAELELRCTCHRRPLLGIARATDDGGMFLHVRIFKRATFYAEIIVEEGPVRLRCRVCRRWFTFRIRKSGIEQKQEQLPPSLSVPELL